ncbi:MAG: hypothetical protein FWF77_00255, partial [Defluviitaleaceae bacterium]|nr:hypothetical protein [Defluviitaleaceae bacterium]
MLKTKRFTAILTALVLIFAIVPVSAQETAPFAAAIQPLSAGGPMVSSGETHTLALTSDGTVLAWGENSRGQLGDGTRTDSLVPVLVQGFPPGLTITSVAAGNGFSLALDADGRVWSWGSNAQGQLGLGNTTDSNLPMEITAITATTGAAIAIAAGG